MDPFFGAAIYDNRPRGAMQSMAGFIKAGDPVVSTTISGPLPPGVRAFAVLSSGSVFRLMSVVSRRAAVRTLQPLDRAISQMADPTAPVAPRTKTTSDDWMLARRSVRAAVVNGTPTVAACAKVRLDGLVDRESRGTRQYWACVPSTEKLKAFPLVPYTSLPSSSDGPSATVPA